MTRPLATSKLLLVEDHRGTATDARPAPVRRYRLARLRVGEAAAAGDDRFAYLRHPHD